MLIPRASIFSWYDVGLRNMKAFKLSKVILRPHVATLLDVFQSEPSVPAEEWLLSQMGILLPAMLGSLRSNQLNVHTFCGMI